ncbi:DUF2063 domain-containing protein [Pseudomonas sp. 2FG]|uniref:HvfC/BufC N-terminal domain-containing protein n=1 Tax=Pseudomonas sp. 2FG TaxID=2502191 RepID=UPI0010F688BD|nr:DNA-binding domain-containing protein [Pseudomonas sp. 2FG]
MRLTAMQKAFEAYLTSGDNDAPPELLESIRGSRTLAAEDGLKIYHNAYRARLLSVLREDFPALYQWLGDDSFEQLAFAYLAAWPSSHFSLRWLGEKLPCFISGYLADPQSSVVRELAELEWAFTLAFDAPDVKPLSLEMMATLSPDEWTSLTVKLQPSVRWLELHYNTLERWKAVKGESPSPDPEPLPEPMICLVWRFDLTCQYRTLGRGEADALKLMVQGNVTFSGLCATLFDELGERAPLQAATWLKQWVSEGLLIQAGPRSDQG